MISLIFLLIQQFFKEPWRYNQTAGLIRAESTDSLHSCLHFLLKICLKAIRTELVPAVWHLNYLMTFTLAIAAWANKLSALLAAV